MGTLVVTFRVMCHGTHKYLLPLKRIRIVFSIKDYIFWFVDVGTKGVVETKVGCPAAGMRELGETNGFSEADGQSVIELYFFVGKGVECMVGARSDY